MKISLCLPVFRRPEMLVQCLNTILLQKHEVYEVIVKDGCETDPVIESKTVRYAFKELGEERLKYIVTKDDGIFPALNQALTAATGDILHFICSDDGLADPEALYWVNQAFIHQEEDEPFWIHGQTANISFAGKVLDIVGAPTTHAALLQHNRIGQPSVFWNRHAFQLAGLFSEEYKHAADYDYWLELYQICDPGFISRPLGMFRKWDDQNTQKNIAQTDREAKRISAKHRGVEVHPMDTEEYWEYHGKVVELVVKELGEEHRHHLERECDFVESFTKNKSVESTADQKRVSLIRGISPRVEQSPKNEV